MECITLPAGNDPFDAGQPPRQTHSAMSVSEEDAAACGQLLAKRPWRETNSGRFSKFNKTHGPHTQVRDTTGTAMLVSFGWCALELVRMYCPGRLEWLSMSCRTASRTLGAVCHSSIRCGCSPISAIVGSASAKGVHSGHPS